MNIPLVDLKAQHETIYREIMQAVSQVFESQTFILGENVEKLEEEVAAYLGVRYGIGVASGTDALLLTLRSYGIGPGDEVMVPAYTFFATAETVALLGATPVFVDIDPLTYCMNVEELEARKTSFTKAIVPVHLYGHPANMEPILDFAKKNALIVIEDNAQAAGAEYRGKKTGSAGHAGCLSFYPTKNLSGCGDGGMVVTNDAALAEKIRKLRSHGCSKKFFPEMIGYNSRLDEIQAAILRVKLKHLDTWNNKRRAVAATYNAFFEEHDLQVPREAPYAKHVYHLYVLRFKRRDRVHEYLDSIGIASAVYYPLSLNLTEPFRHLACRQGVFPEAERASREALAIPLYAEIKEQQIEAVAKGVKQALSHVESEGGGTHKR